MKNDLIKYLEGLEALNQNNTIPSLRDFANADIDIINKLIEFDEFKNVKKINIISLPIYYGHIETGCPIEYIDNYIGQKGKSWTTVTYNYNPSEDEIEFNEEIDLYHIGLGCKQYKTDDLDCGVWKYPKTYSPTDFTLREKIEIRYSLGDIECYKHLTEEESKKELKRIVLEQVSNLIDEKESNLPHTRSILIRCSNRSIKTLNKNK